VQNFTERRKGEDFWLKTIKILAVIAWAIFTVSIYLLGKAQPQIESFFERWLKVSVRKEWDSRLLKYFFNFMIIIFYLSGSGLIINTRRHKRKTDSYNKTLIIFFFISAFCLLIYFIMLS